MSDNIYIYHIPGSKIGVTRNLKDRVEKQQGYKEGEYEVLYIHSDVDIISEKERELQKKYGYESDFNSYAQLSKQHGRFMDINITPNTVTFPVPANKVAQYLEANKGFKFSTNLGTHVVDVPTMGWIIKNIRASHFNPARSYVYNKALAAFEEEKTAEARFASHIEFNTMFPKTPEESFVRTNVERFDLIRGWASAKGLYDKGDVKTQFVKLQEESGEIARSIIKQDLDGLKDGIGDTIVVLTNLAHLAGFTVEECIDAAWNEIKDRTGEMKNGSFQKATL